MNQSEPVNPRSLRTGRSAAVFHGSAIAAEISGCVDIGMKKEALRLTRKVLEKQRILPDEFSEALRTIGIYASCERFPVRYGRPSRAGQGGGCRRIGNSLQESAAPRENRIRAKSPLLRTGTILRLHTSVGARTGRMAGDTSGYVHCSQ